MDITLDGIDASISWSDGKTTISGEDAKKVEELLDGSYGYAGHLFFLEGSSDYDLHHAVTTTLAEYKPSFSRTPEVPSIPKDAVS